VNTAANAAAPGNSGTDAPASTAVDDTEQTVNYVIQTASGTAMPYIRALAISASGSWLAVSAAVRLNHAQVTFITFHYTKCVILLEILLS
jgi:hypothetical protein